jgi:hypothetical protein
MKFVVYFSFAAAITLAFLCFLAIVKCMRQGNIRKVTCAPLMANQHANDEAFNFHFLDSNVSGKFMN